MPHDFALDIETLDLNDVQRFVQDYFLPLAHRTPIDRRVQADLHLSSRHIDVSRSVSVETREDGVGRGRRGQFLNFRTQRFDVRLRFLKRGDELFVLFGGLIELVAGLVQTTDFFFHRLDLHTKLFNFANMFVVA